MELPNKSRTQRAEASRPDADFYRDSLRHAYVNALGHFLRRVVEASNEECDANVYPTAHVEKIDEQRLATIDSV